MTCYNLLEMIYKSDIITLYSLEVETQYLASLFARGKKRIVNRD
jgi:hypothetical protein